MTHAKRAMLGGSLVAVNHTVGAVVTVISALLLSKVLGPHFFAIYIFCSSLSGVSRIASRLGVNACLLTQSEDPKAEDYQVAMATMLGLSVVVACLVTLLLPVLGQFSRISDLFWPGVITVALLPLNVFSLPALTRLERGLKFRPVVMIELASQVLGQVVGISLAFYGWGIWGPLTGWVVRALFYGIVPWMVLGFRPRVAWDSKKAWRMVKFGSGYEVATSLGQSRSLVFLSVIGRVLGQEAVGYMGLTLGVVGLIAPFRAAAARVIIPTLSPIAHITDALRKVVNAAVETELLLSAPVTILATAVYAPSVKLLLGSTWQPTISLFPWVAAGALLASAHAASLSALHIRGFFRESIFSTCIGLAALVGAIAGLGRYGGMEGCAAAAVVIWPASWVNEWFSNRRLGTHWSKNGVAWAIGGAGVCLAWRLGPMILILPVVICVATRTAVQERAKAIFAAFSQRNQGQSVPTLTK